MLAGKFHSQVQDRSSQQLKYSFHKKTKTIVRMLFDVTPRKYIFLEFKLTFAILMPICSIRYTDVL